MVSVAAQAGVLAACMVLFAPMGLAGWHLNCNKVLFFSGALFVSLTVGVHLSPYLPSLPHLLVSSFLPHPAPSSSSCIPFLHRVMWADAGAGGAEDNGATGGVGACGGEVERERKQAEQEGREAREAG